MSCLKTQEFIFSPFDAFLSRESKENSIFQDVFGRCKTYEPDPCFDVLAPQRSSKQVNVVHTFFKVAIIATIIYPSAEFKLGFSRDVPGQTGMGRPVVPLFRDKKILFLLFPLSQDNQRSSVPSSRGTRKSCPVGNPSLNHHWFEHEHVWHTYYLSKKETGTLTDLSCPHPKKSEVR